MASPITDAVWHEIIKEESQQIIHKDFAGRVRIYYRRIVSTIIERGTTYSRDPDISIESLLNLHTSTSDRPSSLSDRVLISVSCKYDLDGWAEATAEYSEVVSDWEVMGEISLPRNNA